MFMLLLVYDRETLRWLRAIVVVIIYYQANLVNKWHQYGLSVNFQDWSTLQI